MSETDEVLVWQAARPLRLFSYVAIAVILVLSIRVVVSFGYLATIGVLLVLGAASQVWWMILRPRMVAGPSGVDIVLHRQPEHVDWRDIRRAQAGPEGIKIYCSNGREVTSRFPTQAKSAGPDQPTEADRVATYLGQRAAWERRPSGVAPRYLPPSTQPPAQQAQAQQPQPKQPDSRQPETQRPETQRPPDTSRNGRSSPQG